jgi:pimeloyl-ACP methyl ester carboxylesterase
MDAGEAREAREARVEPVELHAEVQGSGPVTVLLHGITEDTRCWAPLAEGLGRGRTLVSVDLRGHGRSPGGDDYHPAVMADDVRALLDRLDLPGPDPLVIGHSMGGLVAVAYAAKHPTRGVIDVDQSLDLAGLRETVQQLAPMLRGDGFGDAISMVFDAMRGPLPPAEVERVGAIRRPDQQVVLGVWAPLLELSPEALDDLVRELVAGITVPVLSLHGIDPGPGYAAWLTERVPTATVEVWEGHGHYPHLVDRERFLARVASFDPAR